MSELGSSAAVGIESVEWLDAGGGQLTVRVTGRWRRRRGWVESRGPTMLVLEAEGRRLRFPATPEPPSLSGAAPGTWRLSFSVPAELAHGLGGHVWLALGTVTVPLPVPESAAGPAVEPEVGQRARVEEQRAGGEEQRAGGEERGVGGERGAGEEARAVPSADETEPADLAPERGPGRLEIERAWRRADAAERTAGELGERVSALERALEQERAERARQAVRAEPAGLAGDEQQRLRAEDALRAAHRAAGVRIPAEPIAPAPYPPAGGALRAPADAGALPADAGALPADAAAPPADAPAATADVGLDESWPGDPDTIGALRRELRARVAAEAALHARTVQAETRLAARVLLEQRTTAVLAELRTELDGLRDALERERGGRRAAEATVARLRAELGGQRERSRDAHAAIEELRAAIERLRPEAPEPPPSATGAWPGAPAQPPLAGPDVAPDRLSDALTRLRQTTLPREGEGPPAPGSPPPPGLPAAAGLPAVAGLPGAAGIADVAGAPAAPGLSPAPVDVGAPTVEEPFRRLVARDPERAGRLVIGLLGAQRAAWPHAVAYDLVLGPGYGCVLVSSGERDVTVQRSAAPRAREQVAFQVLGGLAPLARLLSAGALRRLLRIGLARVRGRREGVRPLRALLALPLDLGLLRAAGAAADAETLFTLLAAMIDPAWTRGERFTISHTDERGHAVFLQIRDGQPALVSLEPPAGRVATALSGSAEGLWRAFAGGGPEAGADAAGVQVSGDRGPLALVGTWANRAQSGHGAH